MIIDCIIGIISFIIVIFAIYKFIKDRGKCDSCSGQCDRCKKNYNCLNDNKGS